MTTDEVLTRTVEQVLPDKSALAKLMESKKIRVYLGIDPTGPRLHVGHTIPLAKLQEFADLGHEAILVFGTGTVLAGDPSQRNSARKKITKEDVEENIKDWKRQAEKVLDFKKIQIKYNGDWLLKLSIPELLEIESHLSATQLIKREMFQDRISRGDFIGYHETLYPVLQGYDSVHLDVDLEIGGTDQTFNMLVGRELQKKMKNREKFVLTTPLISGTDGQQMTKSTNNCIWLDDSPSEMFGKVMSIADSQMEQYWTNLTSLDLNGLKKLKPLDAKKRLGFEIVCRFHGKKEADSAIKYFESTFQKGVPDENIPTIEINKPSVELVEFLTENNLAPSKSEAKRLIHDSAVEVDGKTVQESKIIFSNNQVLRVGKKIFVKIMLS